MKCSCVAVLGEKRCRVRGGGSVRLKGWARDGVRGDGAMVALMVGGLGSVTDWFFISTSTVRSVY